MQQGILFHSISEPGSGVFIDQIHFDIELANNQMEDFRTKLGQSGRAGMVCYVPPLSGSRSSNPFRSSRRTAGLTGPRWTTVHFQRINATASSGALLLARPLQGF